MLSGLFQSPPILLIWEVPLLFTPLESPIASKWDEGFFFFSEHGV